MRKKTPFFSIVIPTVNNCNFLKRTIEITLAQSYSDFEIIVSDNASVDDTQQTIKLFCDKRIKYFRNETYVSFPENIRRVLNLANGKYIFTIGDDDFILFEDTLLNIKDILTKNNYGFIRLNILERKLNNNGLQKTALAINEDIRVEKQKDVLTILDFVNRVHIGQFAGLIFKNRAITPKKILDSEQAPWIKIVFENIRKYGAFFSADNYVVITWTQRKGVHPFYKAEKNKLMFEQYVEYILSQFSPKRTNHSLRYYRNYISLLPCAKLYSNNLNTIKFGKRLLELDKNIRYDLTFWLFLFLSLLFPKSLWITIRFFQHKMKDKIKHVKDLKLIIARYNYLYNRYYDSEKK